LLFKVFSAFRDFFFDGFTSGCNFIHGCIGAANPNDAPLTGMCGSGLGWEEAGLGATGTSTDDSGSGSGT
jgi:hypothetical protein